MKIIYMCMFVCKIGLCNRVIALFLYFRLTLKAAFRIEFGLKAYQKERPREREL